MEAGGVGGCGYHLVRVITGFRNKLVSDETVYLAPVKTADLEGFSKWVILEIWFVISL